jgi:hypothetical protein
MSSVRSELSAAPGISMLYINPSVEGSYYYCREAAVQRVGLDALHRMPHELRCHPGKGDGALLSDLDDGVDLTTRMVADASRHAAANMRPVLQGPAGPRGQKRQRPGAICSAQGKPPQQLEQHGRLERQVQLDRRRHPRGPSLEP